MATELNDGEREEVRKYLAAGQKIHAIKVYREATGASLKKAKDAVEAMETMEGQAPRSGSAPGELNKSDREAVRKYLAAGEKIQAIKVYREATGVGLKEAKDAVEAMEAHLPRGSSSPIEPKSKGCLTMILLAISVATACVAVARWWV